MEDTKDLTVPYVVFESTQARAERRDKRNGIVIIVLIVVLALSNLAWLYAWNQYDYVSETSSVNIDSQDGGNANYIGHNGDINNGTN